MTQQNKVLIYFTLMFALILACVVVWMNHSFEVRERDRYATLFKERLTIFGYLEEEKYAEANKLLAILLTGDAMTFEKIGSDINAKEYDLCARLSQKVKEKLMAFHHAEKMDGDNDLEFNKLESSCVSR